MSAIPPDIAGSAAQAATTSAEAARVRDADRVGQAHAAARQAQAVQDQANSVDTTDGDTAVFSDAEGMGSQGRDLDDGEATREQHAADDATHAGQDASDEPGGIDLTA